MLHLRQRVVVFLRELVQVPEVFYAQSLEFHRPLSHCTPMQKCLKILSLGYHIQLSILQSTVWTDLWFWGTIHLLSCIERQQGLPLSYRASKAHHFGQKDSQVVLILFGFDYLEVE
jgi:hypothetical protein